MPTPIVGRVTGRIALAFALLLAPLIALGGPAPSALAAGTVALGLGPYTESFDTLVNSGTGTGTPAGWDFAEAGTSAGTTYSAGTGSSNTGDTYSFGAAGSGERAFGGLQSGSLTPTIGAAFTNSTGATITALAVSYTGEQWRLGTAGRADRIDFQYSLDAASLSSGTWTDVDALDFSGPNTAVTGALDGNAAANRTAMTGSISGLSIAPQATFWLRWSDVNASGADDGLAVDDFSLTATVAAGGEPIVTVTAPDGAAAEPGQGPGAFRVSRTGDTAAALTVSVMVGGTATAGDDYTPALGPTVSIIAGAAFADVTITPVDDAASEGDETVTLSATAGSGYTVGAPSSATVTIADDDGPGAPCGAADTPIGQVQGTGAASPLTGATVTVQGVVVGDYEAPAGASQIRGFYLEDPGDANPASSDGIFVYTGGSDRVSLGQVVQVTGAVSEFQAQTQLGGALAIEHCGGTGTVTPADMALPLPSAADPERFEGMLVRFPQTLYVSELFQLGRFGQLVLSANGRLAQPTSAVAPGAAANALAATNALNRIILDDATNLEDPDPIVYGRGGQPLSASNTLRAGDSVTGLTGVLGYGWAGAAASGNAYRVRAVGDLDPALPDFVAANPRPASAPLVGGSLTVAATNVLNYFLTLDSTSGSGPCGPSATLECRGANTAEELTRQRAKLLQALKGLDADVLGLIEIENTAGVDTVGDLVSGLNGLTAPGTFAAIDTGTIGGDAIKVGIIYRPAAVTPVGPYRILDSGADPRFIDTRNRPVLAQAFRERATGEDFTLAVAHLKSKGSGCADLGDPDTGDGQGNCNLTRTAAAKALVDWLAATFSDPDVLIVGDLNAYAREDPVTAILAGPDDQAGTADDFTNLILQHAGAEAYSYAFDGQWGYLDHALASPSMAAQVTGAAEWHINADEPSALDYNTEFKSAGQVSGLYAADAFRTSDHDPLRVGLRLGPPNGAPHRAYLPLVAR